MQLLPSPEYPGLQVQLWEPSVLLQKALMSQLWLLLVHSSISLKKNPQSEKISTFNHHLHKGTRSTHTHKKTKDTKKPSFICKDLISITILSLVYISVVYMKKQRIRTCYYQCSYFHLQSIQAYRYNYEIPRYYYTQHWCHSYGCWLYTRQYLGRKALNVVKSIIFTFQFHRGGIRLKPRIKNRFVHKEAKN